MGRSQTDAGQRVGAISRVTAEDSHVAETRSNSWTETDGHEARLAGSHVEWAAALDGEGRHGCNAAGESQSAAVEKLEALCVRLSQHHRAEIQIGRAERQLRWQIGLGRSVGDPGA